MAHCNTVLSQLFEWVPRHEFGTLVISAAEPPVVSGYAGLIF